MQRLCRSAHVDIHCAAFRAPCKYRTQPHWTCRNFETTEFRNIFLMYYFDRHTFDLKGTSHIKFLNVRYKI